jgi:glycosyltransferase involved in cell wall biosynthesis
MSFPPGAYLGMILKGYPRISETFISNEILRLEQLGFQIHLFSMRKPRESFAHESVKKIKAKVDYLPEKILPNLHRLLPPNILLAAKSPVIYRKALTLALRRLARTHKAATFKHLLQAGYLVQKLLPATNVGHFHAHFAHSPSSVAMFASLLSGYLFSFTAHAKDIYTSDVRQLKEKIGRARFVVTCTEYNRRYLKRLAGRLATPIYRVYHGIDLDFFGRIKKDAGKGPHAPYQLLTVARITEKKGLPTVYRALKQLHDQGLAFKHTLIGDGDQRRVILDLIAELGLTSVTRCLGTQPHEVVLQHYRQADLFVLGCEVAQNGDRDGIPNVLLESMLMGVPVVTTPVSAIPEVIVAEHTGLLVPPREPHKMAVAIKRLLSDEPLRARVKEAGWQMVKESFDNRLLSQKLAGIYQKQGVNPCRLL